jgi:hypothetical protein
MRCTDTCLTGTLGACTAKRMPTHFPKGITMKESNHEHRKSRSGVGFFALVLAVGLFTAQPAGSEEVKEARNHQDKSVTFAFSDELKREVEKLNDFDDGDFDKEYGKNISGIVFAEGYLLIGADEGVTALVLKRKAPNTFDYMGELDGIIRLEKKAEEIDIEGITRGEKYFYVIGSHSRKRLKVNNDLKDDETVQDNVNRLSQTAIEPSRERLFRLKLKDDGTFDKNDKKSLKSMSLRDFILNHPVLGPFQVIASKENGVDIEGIAADGDDKLYIGFRGPRLRGNYVPVMVLQPKIGKEEDFKEKFREKDVAQEVRYVNLDGLGIRGMAAVKGGFLILGGPVGDEPLPYHVFFWDGENTVPGKHKRDAKQSHIKTLCKIPVPKNIKAEGITILKEEPGTYLFMIVYDGAEYGGADIFSCDA